VPVPSHSMMQGFDPLGEELRLFLVQVVIVLVSVRILGKLLKRFRQVWASCVRCSCFLCPFLLRFFYVSCSKFGACIIWRVSAPQPTVNGEVLAGILLGPSCMGYIPGFTDHLFPPASLPILSLFARVGLLFFMFFLGLEVDPRLMAGTWRKSLPIASNQRCLFSVQCSCLSVRVCE
jgi:Kef-type K+ transport system membrane component KefB